MKVNLFSGWGFLKMSARFLGAFGVSGLILYNGSILGIYGNNFHAPAS